MSPGANPLGVYSALRLIAFALLMTAPLAAGQPPFPNKTEPLDAVAVGYVRLVLAVGLYDPDYVDAYYGPKAWRQEVESGKPDLATIRSRATGLLHQASSANVGAGDRLVELRRRYLVTQLSSLVARVDMLSGKKQDFDEQAKALYDAQPPIHTEKDFQPVLDELDRLLPGPGSLAERYQEFRRQFVVPREKLDAVFQAALREVRNRTRQHIQLNREENFRVEYVKGKPWDAYNWYQGHYKSLIQINLDQPVDIDTVIRWAGHEGYPGHHVQNVLLEADLVQGRKWPEYSVSALYSPQSLISEGAADYGVELVLPRGDAIEFKTRVLYPLAGINPNLARKKEAVQELVEKLDYAQNEAARRYMSGGITRDEAIRWLQKYTLASPQRAERSIRNIQRQGAYVINYNFGRDLIRGYIEKRAGKAGASPEAWKELELLLSIPRVPSELN